LLDGSTVKLMRLCFWIEQRIFKNIAILVSGCSYFMSASPISLWILLITVNKKILKFFAYHHRPHVLHPLDRTVHKITKCLLSSGSHVIHALSSVGKCNFGEFFLHHLVKVQQLDVLGCTLQQQCSLKLHISSLNSLH